MNAQYTSVRFIHHNLCHPPGIARHEGPCHSVHAEGLVPPDPGRPSGLAFGQSHPGDLRHGENSVGNERAVKGAFQIRKGVHGCNLSAVPCSSLQHRLTGDIPCGPDIRCRSFQSGIDKHSPFWTRLHPGPIEPEIFCIGGAHRRQGAVVLQKTPVRFP